MIGKKSVKKGIKMDNLINRLKEVSTWQGLIAILTGFGVVVSGELQGAIAGLGVALFTAVSVIMKERGSDDAKK